MLNNNSEIRISVCIATYNGEKYIMEQLLSILEQLDNNDEIIISDDHSEDKTIEIVKSLNCKRIKIYTNNKEKGYTSNFENALSYSSGKYIFTCDQDDIWLPNKVRTCLTYLEEYDFIVSDAKVVDSNKNIILNSFFSFSKPSSTLFGNLYKFSYLGCCMCFKKEALNKALPFPRKRKFCTHDNWLFLIGCAYFKYKILNQSLILYRRHGNNTSQGAEKKIKRNSLLFMLNYRIYLIYNLILRK